MTPPTKGSPGSSPRRDEWPAAGAYTREMAPNATSPLDGQEPLLDEAIALFYEGATQAAPRRRGLSLLAQLLDAAGAVDVVWDRARGRIVRCDVAGALPADRAAQYAARWAAIDPRRKFLERGHDESIFVSHYDRDNADPDDAPFFDAFLAACGVGHSLGANLGVGGTTLRQVYVERRLGAAPFSVGEVRAFRRLVRHLANAERMAQAARRRAVDAALPWRLLDSLPVGTIIADRDRRILFANEAAEEILAAGDGLSRHDDLLQAARAFETNALSAHLRDAVACARPSGGEGGALLVARPSGRRPYALVVVALPPRAGDDGPGERAEHGDEAAAARAVVFVTDLDGPSGALAPRLTQLFGLSKAEARVAVGIVEGRRLHEIAQDCAVRMPTVRTQLRAVLKKVGAARQADLVRIVLALPATLPAPRDDAPPALAKAVGL